ncbi:phage tail family protein [Niallia sp. RD1]|uniref:phage tail family protein n=1 Tax=Niallia sp. RD1 TaxID=2962858 RepID=UPI0020C1B8DA|nr:phage tail family protein [Niallia sp. RD1]UTI42097.1 phage tail family protein [Niallia sp. RD1]
MYLTIMKDNRTIDHRDLGANLLSFRKASLEATNNYETVEGRHGLIPNGTVWGGRKLTAGFIIQALDHTDLILVIDEFMEIFSTEEEIGLIDSRQPGKIWFAKVDSEFTPEFVNASTGKFTIDFTSSSPFCRSLGSTLDDPIDYGNDQWQAIGGEISLEDDAVYKFNTSSFKVYNGGVLVDPRQFPLNITFKGTSSNLQIKNNTTGDLFTYKGNTSNSDKIELNRIRHLKNGVSIFANTNHKRITLAHGWNEFEVFGASNSFEITFDFNFWYK